MNRVIPFQTNIQDLMIKLKLFFVVSNWFVVVADYFDLLKSNKYIVNFRNGMSIQLRSGTTDKWSIHEVILRDDYRLKEISDSSRIVIDLGANAGVFSVYASNLLSSTKIFAYEPEKSNYNLLVNNIKRNNLSKKVIPFYMACTSKSGVGYLNIDSDIRSHNISKKSGLKSVIVKTISLQEIIKTNNLTTVDLLKMDIEGSEYDILYKLPQNIYKKIKSIAMEFHNIDKGKQNGKHLEKFLHKNNYHVDRKDFIKGNVGLLYATRNKI